MTPSPARQFIDPGHARLACTLSHQRPSGWTGLYHLDTMGLSPEKSYRTSSLQLEEPRKHLFLELFRSLPVAY